MAAAERKTNLPWGKCLLCSKLGTGGTVVCLLPCMHALCAEPCVENYFRGLKKQESGSKRYHCEACLREFSSMDDLRERVVLDTFLPKKLTLNCISLCCGLCLFKDCGKKFCTDCGIYLCLTCTEYHHIYRKTYKHKVEDISSQMMQVEFERFMETRNKCELHEGMEFKLSCLTCKKMMCSDCRLDHDKNHSFCAVAETIAAVCENYESAKKSDDEARLEVMRLEGELLCFDGESGASIQETGNITIIKKTDKFQLTIQEKQQFSGHDKKQVLNQIIRLRKVVDDAMYFQVLMDQVTQNLDDIGILNFSKISQKLFDRATKSPALAKASSFLNNVKKSQGQLQSELPNLLIPQDIIDETSAEPSPESLESSTFFSGYVGESLIMATSLCRVKKVTVEESEAD